MAKVSVNLIQNKTREDRTSVTTFKWKTLYLVSSIERTYGYRNALVINLCLAPLVLSHSPLLMQWEVLCSNPPCVGHSAGNVVSVSVYLLNEKKKTTNQVQDYPKY